MCDDLELTIVIPCLNESETIGVCIQKANVFLNNNRIKGEVIVADNGSSDESGSIANSLGAIVVTIDDKGYGNALRGGIGAARGKYIIMGDADDSYDFSDLMPFIVKLREGYDLVMGNRFEGGISPGAMPWKHRYFGNPVLTAIGKMFFNSPANDFHCGLRGFTKKAYEKMQLVTSGMEFASEMVIKASLMEMKITEVPTFLSKDGRSRAPHLKSWRDGWRHLRFILIYSPKWLFYFPGIFLMVLGIIIISLILLTGGIKIGTAVMSTYSALYGMVMIVVGYQGLLFSNFANDFAVNTGLKIGLGYQRKGECRKYSLEKGVVFGSALFIIGLVVTFYALIEWSKTPYGEYANKGLTLVIPAATLMIVGAQSVLASFFSGLLNIKLSNEERTEEKGFL